MLLVNTLRGNCYQSSYFGIYNVVVYLDPSPVLRSRESGDWELESIMKPSVLYKQGGQHMRIKAVATPPLFNPSLHTYNDILIFKRDYRPAHGHFPSSHHTRRQDCYY